MSLRLSLRARLVFERDRRPQRYTVHTTTLPGGASNRVQRGRKSHLRAFGHQRDEVPLTSPCPSVEHNDSRSPRPLLCRPHLEYRAVKSEGMSLMGGRSIDRIASPRRHCSGHQLHAEIRSGRGKRGRLMQIATVYDHADALKRELISPPLLERERDLGAKEPGIPPSRAKISRMC